MSSLIYEFENFRLDVKKRQLLRNGKKIELTRLGFDLLLFLINNRDRVVGYDEIFQEVWEIKAPKGNSASIHDCISKIREALSSEDREKIIKTSRGVGYRFMVEVKELQISEPREKVGWVEWCEKNRFLLAMIGVVIIELLIACIISYYRYGDLKEEKSIKGVSHIFTISGSIAHIIIIFSALFYIPFILKEPKKFRPAEEDYDDDGEIREEIRSLGYESREKWEKARKLAKVALGKYHKYFVRLLFVWFVFYAFIGIVEYIEFKKNAELSSNIAVLTIGLIRNFFNNLNTVFIFLCFITLYRPLRIVSKANNERIGGLEFYIGAAVVVIFLIVEIGFLIGSGKMDAGFLDAKFDPSKEELPVTFIFRMISGFFGGLALALFIGRLQSRFLGLSNVLLYLLFAYVTIQPLFVLFDKPIWKAFIISAALVLKCLLIALTANLLASGRLLYYFVRLRQDYEEEWHDFNQILRP